METTHQPLSLEEFKKFVYSENLKPVQDRLYKIEGWPKRHIAKALEQYRNFLILRKKYGHQYELPPSVDIDEVWHAHILHTEDYINFCDHAFGYFLHHHPHHGKNNELSDKDMAQLFEQTQSLYCKEFGDYLYKTQPKFLTKKITKLVATFKSYLTALGKKLNFDHYAV